MVPQVRWAGDDGKGRRKGMRQHVVPRASPRTPRWEDEPDPVEDGGSADEGWEAAEEEGEDNGGEE